MIERGLRLSRLAVARLRSAGWTMSARVAPRFVRPDSSYALSRIAIDANAPPYHRFQIYRHPNCLNKHRWEHTRQWREASKFVLSKHQQVQLLEVRSFSWGGQ
jgi:hypothetical protein